MLTYAERPNPTVTIAVVLGAGLIALPLIRGLDLPWDLVVSAIVGIIAGGIVYGIQFIRVRRLKHSAPDDERTPTDIHPPTRE